MSDRMPSPLGQAPPQQPQAPNQAPPALDAIESNRSILNPSDALTMAGRAGQGGIDETTPLVDILPYLGLDPNAPGIPQLRSFLERQTSNASPTGKLQNIAAGKHMSPGAGNAAVGALSGGASPMGGGMPPDPMGGGMPPGGGGVGDVDSLIGALGG